MINDYKQLDKIVCEELNIKSLIRYLAESEQEKLSLIYVLSENSYYFQIGDKKTPAKDEIVVSLLKSTT